MNIRVIQQPNEFVIARASAYHQGFNGGFNIAEAVNFATPSWVVETAPNTAASDSQRCMCNSDGVRFNLPFMYRSILTNGKSSDSLEKMM